MVPFSVLSQNPVSAIPKQQSRRFYPNQFVNLHVHTDKGSILDAFALDYGRVKQLDKGMAITEHGTLFSLLDFAYNMKKIGKTPIFGIEAYVDSRLGFKNKKSYGHKKKYYHLILLAKSTEGLLALYEMVSKSEELKQSEGSKPIIQYEDIERYSNEFVCMTACLGGELAQYLMHGQVNEAREYILSMKELFQDDLYIEIQRHGIPEEDIVNPGLVSLSRELGVKLVATPDAHYSRPEQAEAHRALLCKRYKKTLKDADSPRFPGSGYHLLTPQEAEQLFWDLPDALDSTIEIWNKCKGVEIAFPSGIKDYHFPKFPVPQGYTEADYFKALCIEGYNKRFSGNIEKYNNQKHIDRLNLEISTILSMNFPGYFLLVADIVNFCKQKGIWVGPGRGSVAGSLVAYCMGITDTLDPLDYDFLFERFLNIARQSAPDIDLDFDSVRRDEVIEYIKNKYGEDRTAQIITFGTMGAKAAIRDACKVLGHNYSLGQSISKLISGKQGVSLSEAFNSSESLRMRYSNEPDIKEIFDLAIQLEGTVTNISKHAAAVVVADKPLSTYLPTARIPETEQKGQNVTKENRLVRVTQFTMTDVERLGLMKIDILGLGTLTQMRETIELVNKTRLSNGLPPITIEQIPLDDLMVYINLLGKGDTDGVFQVGSADMKGLMRQLYTTVATSGKECFEALIAGISLNRPGPMKFIPTFIQNRLNPNNITYAHKKLKPILAATYGCLVYQEQVSLIAQVLAGYSPEQADILRRAVSKKSDEIMEKERIPFVYGATDQNGNVIVPGCVRLGISAELANSIYDDIVDFSKYAFNKSHGGSYSVLTFKTAWLKYYYPTEFMAALLTRASLGSDNKKLPAALTTCRNMGITVLPPDINKSETNFTIEGDKVIRFGLAGVKQLGISSATKIVYERKQGGEFSSYQTLANRLHAQGLLNKKTLEGLIYSGSLDCFDKSRKAKINAIEIVSDEAKKGFNYMSTLFDDLIDNSYDRIAACEEYEYTEKLNLERSFLGAFISENPLDRYVDVIKNSGVAYIKDILKETEEFEDEEFENNDCIYADGEEVKLIGYVSDVEIKQGKKKPFLTFTLTDHTNTVRGTAGIEYQDKLQDGKVVYINATLEHSEKYGTQLKFAKVSRILPKGDNSITADMLQVNNRSLIVAHINHFNDIAKFKGISQASNLPPNVSLYFTCLTTKRHFVCTEKVAIQDQRIFDFLKSNTECLIIR